jgi:hypothetical protein
MVPRAEECLFYELSALDQHLLMQRRVVCQGLYCKGIDHILGVIHGATTSGWSFLHGSAHWRQSNKASFLGSGVKLVEDLAGGGWVSAQQSI